MLNVLSVLVVAALAALFIWLAVRAARSRRGWVKWPGLFFSGLLGLVFLAVTVMSLLGFYRMSTPPYTYQTSAFKVTMTQENIARGEHLVNMCADCHSSTGSLPLDGSKDNMLAGGGPPLGALYAPNLTPGGPLKDWTDGQIVRALREGVDKDGHPLVFMPSQAFHHASDADAQAIVAYLRSQKAVNRDLPKRDLNILAAVLLGSGMFPTSAQTPITAPVLAPEAGSPDYGKYMVNVSGCADCHGANLTGGGGGFAPSGPNLTLIVPAWKEEQFIQFMRSGVDPTGRKIDPQQMPWKSFGLAYSDDELRALYSYLHGLEQVDTPTK